VKTPSIATSYWGERKDNAKKKKKKKNDQDKFDAPFETVRRKEGAVRKPLVRVSLVWLGDSVRVRIASYDHYFEFW
jgi:hypothetical protein